MTKFNTINISCYKNHTILCAYTSGLQAQIWTETIRTAEQMDAMTYPRLLAAAERAWHKAPWEAEKDAHKRDRLKSEDWEKFANTVGYQELARLDQMGIHYRIPLPGAM